MIRPLTYPKISDKLEIIITPVLLDQPTDLVFLDRLWNRAVSSFDHSEKLIAKINDLKAKLIYFTDDDLSSEAVLGKGYTKDEIKIFKYFLQNAHLIIVTTNYLKTRLSTYGTPILVIPNYLDERLIIHHLKHYSFNNGFLVGYMGTPTHNEDLNMVIPALIEFQKNHDDVIYEFVGAYNNSTFQNITSINNLKFHKLSPSPDESEYPLFYIWWTSSICWDLAIAPLQSNEFNLNKSDIKFLDYAAISVPGIFSDTLAYQSTVPGRGILVKNTIEEWLTALENLYNNRELINSFRTEATKYLYSERILYHGVSKFNQIFDLI